MNRLRIASFLAAALCVALSQAALGQTRTTSGSAFSDAPLPELDFGAAPKPVHGKKHATAAKAPASLDQYSHDLLKGSAEQQDMERRDNENAATRPIDHSKDPFLSDVKAFRGN